MLTTVRTQTKTHCEWPEVPRYPLRQHTCSRVSTGNCLAETDLVLNNTLPALSRKGCARCLSHLFYTSLHPITSPLGEYVLFSTLRTWYFVYLGGSKRRKEGGRTRGSHGRPSLPLVRVSCTQHSTLEEQPVQVTLQQCCIRLLGLWGDSEMSHLSSLSTNF